ncbi:hypothetical protein OCHUTO_0339 [Orientia chuto str. Dubai]|uniref:Uncharacterized protein n=1 Tax=Orientia chuto str. Dubai TaxID=1359168 RepID=A0A0F3MLV8_9RICK|nr:hypothetical protein OCHUTO_0339 [Orientia chuto str. Dubai]
MVCYLMIRLFKTRITSQSLQLRIEVDIWYIETVFSVLKGYFDLE